MEIVTVSENNSREKRAQDGEGIMVKAGRPVLIREFERDDGVPVDGKWVYCISLADAERYIAQRTGVKAAKNPAWFSHALKGGWLAPILNGKVVKTPKRNGAVFKVKDVEPLLDGEVWVGITQEMVEWAGLGEDTARLAKEEKKTGKKLFG